MSSTTVVIGSRESRLAVIQSEMVRDYIEKNNDGLKAELLTMKTTGDIILDRTLDKVGGKGLFVKELDRALLDGRSELSVHSLKDMPMEVPEELPLLAFSKREDPRDALVLPQGVTELDKTKPIGCSSLRRTLQLAELFPDTECKSVRGNVQTRLKKLDSGEYSALVLAAAGLKRLGLTHRISRYFEPEEMLPAAGQGIFDGPGQKRERLLLSGRLRRCGQHLRGSGGTVFCEVFRRRMFFTGCSTRGCGSGEDRAYRTLLRGGDRRL